MGTPSGRWVPTAETPSRTSIRRPDRGRARALGGARRIGGPRPGVVAATNTAGVAVPNGMGQSRSMASERRREIADRMPGARDSPNCGLRIFARERRPRSIMLVGIGGAPRTSIRANRLRSISSAMRPCRRASGPPRQWWMPPPLHSPPSRSTLSTVWSAIRFCAARSHRWRGDCAGCPDVMPGPAVERQDPMPRPPARPRAEEGRRFAVDPRGAARVLDKALGASGIGFPRPQEGRRHERTRHWRLVRGNHRGRGHLPDLPSTARGPVPGSCGESSATVAPRGPGSGGRYGSPGRAMR